ncbi:MAG TPA: phosphopentomutase [Candidatus Merdiplasma excrementigallinarum]|uniref:Phosphopentomutase n=1 Tax=Candidatus Merdiplasma excrementigallinarum TaxID=2840864 RepID=A0A9D1T930_9FIRM|nr:phosphopentomutase [Candidatus Merdiplasma excrementigallinarum]
MSVKRVFVIVLDSYGIGWLPDADKFGDVGANTLATIVKSEKYDTPNMKKMGLFNIDGVACGEGVENPIGSYGRMAEASMGKDTTIGHWEIAGMISSSPLPTYPDGFPQEVLAPFSEQTGRGVLCNKPYSGTDVIRDYGEEHLRTGNLIVYTSADSVFQIAAHEELVPLEELYRDCRIAREILQGKHGVGRVIARPFVGTCAADFTRTRNRHDFSLIPPRKTMMVSLKEHGFDTYGVGKIYDIFAGQAIDHTVSMTCNEDGMEKTLAYMDEDFNGLCFVNLVDFDMMYGHRNDIDGYANAATVFDRQLGQFMEKMREDDVVIITADHGCDPGFKGTDHSREYTPMLIYGAPVKGGVSIGTRSTFADIGATVLDMLGVDERLDGTSYWDLVKK